MKKRAPVLVLLILISALCVYAAATGGDRGDPLVTLSHLNGTYQATVDQRVNELLSGSSPAGSSPAASSASVWTERRLKAGDVLAGSTGTGVLLLAGGVTVSYPTGAVVDATDGTEIASGASLVVRHRYIVAEDTAAAFTVTGKTAVLNYQGTYAFTHSAAVDYNAMAQALKSMQLFRGSLTGYGSGFDLEVSPTRLQALIMFIRLLGEEDEALAYTGSTPFKDIEKGSEPERYVGYAYAKGYSNGYTTTTFNPGQKVNAYQYTEFILRALGYSNTDTTDLSGTLTRAVDCGVLTAGETAMLARDQFLRADLVYVSYYALDAKLSGTGQLLREALIAKGSFTAAESAAAGALVSGPRIS